MKLQLSSLQRELAAAAGGLKHKKTKNDAVVWIDSQLELNHLVTRLAASAQQQEQNNSNDDEQQALKDVKILQQRGGRNVLSISGFLQILPVAGVCDSLQSLSLTNVAVGAQDAALLETALLASSSSSCLQSLHIGRLQAAGVPALCRALEELPHNGPKKLQSLRLTYDKRSSSSTTTTATTTTPSPSDSTDRALGRLLCRALQKNQTLTTVELMGFSLLASTTNDEDDDDVSRMLDANPQWESLRLSDCCSSSLPVAPEDRNNNNNNTSANASTSSTFLKIAQAVQRHGRLQSLDLSNNHLKDWTAFAVLLETPSSLRKLVLSLNDFDCKELQQQQQQLQQRIYQALSHATLTELWMDSNHNIGLTPLFWNDTLLAALQNHNTTLQKVVLLPSRSLSRGSSSSNVVKQVEYWTQLNVHGRGWWRRVQTNNNNNSSSRTLQNATTASSVSMIPNTLARISNDPSLVFGMITENPNNLSYVV